MSHTAHNMNYHILLPLFFSFICILFLFTSLLLALLFLSLHYSSHKFNFHFSVWSLWNAALQLKLPPQYHINLFQESNAGCDVTVHAKLKELQEELHELKMQVKQLLPETEIALESEGRSASPSCQTVIHNMFVQRSLSHLLCVCVCSQMSIIQHQHRALGEEVRRSNS